MQQPYDVKDLKLAPNGHKKIAWAWRHMPVLQSLHAEFIKTKPFAGMRLAVSIHVEAKTGCLAKVLAAGGAEVALTGCNPLSTQDDVAAALVEDGLSVFAIHGESMESYQTHLKQALSIYPRVVIDDGGDLAFLLHTECKELGRDIIGGCEETTTGVHRLRALAAEDKLLYPVIAVNDARCKHLFDNRFGTGQSVWTAIMSLTNLIVAGKTVVVAGFGMCGRGVALRAKGLGARVIVTEIDPIAACEALMEGYDVMTMEEAAPHGDIFVTVTGCNHVIDERHFNQLKDGAIMCNAGHFDIEIDLKSLAAMATEQAEVRDGVVGYTLSNGKQVCVLAEGRLVNLAGGDGHPAEIMDMSFALQAQSALWLIEHQTDLITKVYEVPTEADRRVAERLLASLNLHVDTLTDDQAAYLNSW
ncbi:MAG TPA: adenosylhomocysteinase [Clostridiaceae bacterium]|nr:adenosylhomocysteinase [Clostridiaceae bacterium]